MAVFSKHRSAGSRLYNLVDHILLVKVRMKSVNLAKLFSQIGRINRPPDPQFNRLQA